MSATGTSLRALRDRAIILLGFAGAFRRSELSRRPALCWCDTDGMRGCSPAHPHQSLVISNRN
jgi:hypothetical protein